MKQEIQERLNKLQREMKDMDTIVREDIEDTSLKEEDMFRINEKIKELEKNIVNIIEG